ncbi:hypothetical protein [Paraburkholderia sp. ZP32-5]|uniref:hypothetical protein n=1 Tax=Paraburkholderia sp. ZP32-5 TaxID=2883245 RepID=UPI001F3B40B1|nr:hypothetical protein [Paraburkholderia sp. ZP32-5]
MNPTRRHPAAPGGARHPAALVDSQLRHLENVVRYLTRGRTTHSDEFDQRYWEQRIRALEQTHELIASQRDRIARLRHRLGVEAACDSPSRE